MADAMAAGARGGPAQTTDYQQIPISAPRPRVADITGVRRSRAHYFAKLAQTILLRPITTTVTLALRTVKLLTWVPAKAGYYLITCNGSGSVSYFMRELVKTAMAVRDILNIPSLIISAFKDMVATRERATHDIPQGATQDFLGDHLQVPCLKHYQQYRSYLHGTRTCDVYCPQIISEAPAFSDPDLRTIKASHLFRPGVMAIDFGLPNVATFVTEEGEGGIVDAVKVDAKSLKRADMSFDATRDSKIQSGVFLVPTNLPEGALCRFKEAAEEMAGRRDITCVNTNCRVLKKAGFSIEGVAIEKIVLPTKLFEHLLFRDVFYTDEAGGKHKVHFEIINTTPKVLVTGLEEYIKEVDMAVVGTPLRHWRRQADTKEAKKARGDEAKTHFEREGALIKEHIRRAEDAHPALEVNEVPSLPRKVTISVPSTLGNMAARKWGRHTIFEVDLSDSQDEISRSFENKLPPFPETKGIVSFIKQYIIFSGPMIRFLRSNMMGRAHVEYSDGKNLGQHLMAATEETPLNYVLLDDKVVMAWVHANGKSSKEGGKSSKEGGKRSKVYRKASDWALSKHALLASRQGVYCSGEMWYDNDQNKFVMNNDSGTYLPERERLEAVVVLANKVFAGFRKPFIAAPAKEEAAEVE